jgi:hypothetical protein
LPKTLGRGRFGMEPTASGGMSAKGVMRGLNEGEPHVRQLRFKGAIELAEPGIAVTAWIGCDIFVPDDQQGDVLALHSR